MAEERTSGGGRKIGEVKRAAWKGRKKRSSEWERSERAKGQESRGRAGPGKAAECGADQEADGPGNLERAGGAPSAAKLRCAWEVEDNRVGGRRPRTPSLSA